MNEKLLVCATVLALGLGAVTVAQEKADKQEKQEKADKQEKFTMPPARLSAVPLKLQLVLSRYQGEKKISSLNYALSVNANSPTTGPGRASLRMGAQIAVATGGDNKMMPGSFQYKELGTNIDCDANSQDDGRFRVTITIEDSSVYGDDQGGSPDLKRAGDHPAFRSFRASETMVLRDGQSMQYTTATDKISGEVVKIDVTLNVIK